MKKLTYNNINCSFTFEDVFSKITKFWIDEVIKLNHNKIWLTISIVDENNKTFTLINNLPFNITDFTDIIIVLKQIFETSNLYNRKEKLKIITFKYYTENKHKNRFNYKGFMLNVFLYIILVVVTISLTIYALNFLFDVYQGINFDQIINHDHVNEEVLSWENNAIKTKETDKVKNTKSCVFDPFIKLFDSGGSYKYVPSKFLDSNINTEINDFNLLEYIIHNQYLILDYAIADSSEAIKILKDTLKEYQSITNLLV